jgi:hypothetical protein
MTTKTLSGVTLQTLDNYRTAATQAVVAYRSGGHRLVKLVNGTLEGRVYPRTARIAPRVTDRMNDVRDSVSEIVVKGIDQVADRTEKAIELGSATAAAQVARVAEFAAGVGNELVASGLQAVARLTMPGANVALVLSSKVAAGADALAEVAGARPLHRAVRKAGAGAKRKATPAARKTKAAVETAAKRVVKAAKSTRTPVAKVQRAARTAKRAVAA